jgi:hypothetical protein
MLAPRASVHAAMVLTGMATRLSLRARQSHAIGWSAALEGGRNTGTPWTASVPLWLVAGPVVESQQRQCLQPGGSEAVPPEVEGAAVAIPQFATAGRPSGGSTAPER